KAPGRGTRLPAGEHAAAWLAPRISHDSNWITGRIPQEACKENSPPAIAPCFVFCLHLHGDEFTLLWSTSFIILLFTAEVAMRVVALVLTGSLGLLIACTVTKPSDKGSAPVKKELLPGKWQATDDVAETQYVQAYEFTADGKAKMTVLGMADPLPAKYSWTD